MRLRDLDALFELAERRIALVDRSTPLRYGASLASLVSDWQRGQRTAPTWEYAPPPDLDELRGILEGVMADGPYGALYAARAAELATEAAAVAHVGTRDFQAYAARRFHAPQDADGARAAGLADAWSGGTVDPDVPTSASDDARDPHSLVSAMQRAVGEQRLAFRVLLAPDLASAAATGNGVILVRAGARYGARAVRRTVLHEIEGHALPRHRAAAEELGLFRSGAAGGADDEEGRALLLERRAGFLDAGRRAELARRHLAAASVRDGAEFADTVDVLRDRGAPLEQALEIAARVHRGGGLAREIVYLPALCRVERAFDEDPAIERYLERGPIGVAAALELAQLGVT